MKKDPCYKLNTDPEIISGFRRTLGEIEWLLLALVLFYLVAGNVDYEEKPTLIAICCLYAAVVLAFQYWNFFRESKQWKLAFQTWVMILFISWVIWYSGKLESPLFNLYILAVLASAITLGKVVTLLEVGLIFSIFMYLANGVPHNPPGALFAMFGGSDILMLFFPLLLVAYISTMLASDIQNGYNKIKTISEIDDLTQLLNYRTFKMLAEKIFKQANRQNSSLALLMLDLDNLKFTNDHYGHETGNLLLSNTSRCLNAILREGDIAARYGGDEFVVLLSQCDIDGAEHAANRIIEQFNVNQIRYQGSIIKLSASIGIACFPEHGRTLDSLLYKADKSMYFSKHHNRGFATVYKPSLDS